MVTGTLAYFCLQCLVHRTGPIWIKLLIWNGQFCESSTLCKRVVFSFPLPTPKSVVYLVFIINVDFHLSVQLIKLLPKANTTKPLTTTKIFPSLVLTLQVGSGSKTTLGSEGAWETFPSSKGNLQITTVKDC